MCDPLSVAGAVTTILDVSANLIERTTATATTSIRPWLLRQLGSEQENCVQTVRNCWKPEIDIICIPDLNKDPVETWTTDDPTGGGKVNWLTDLLPQEFPNARIMVFEYRALVSTPEYFTRQALFSQAHDLLEDLYWKRRRRALRRPILFIAHGAGSIIAKSALIQSSSAVTRHSEHLRSVYLSTSGMLFFDTTDRRRCPYSEKWDLVLSKMFKSALQRPKSDAVWTTMPNSQWLGLQMDRFKSISSKFQIYTFIGIEARPARLMYWAKHERTSGERQQLALSVDGIDHLATDKVPEILHRRPTEVVRFSLRDDDFKRVVRSMKSCMRDYTDAGSEPLDRLKGDDSAMVDERLTKAERTDDPITAIGLYTDALHKSEWLLGNIHSKTLDIVAMLASSYRKSRNLEAAESLYQRLLVSRERTEGLCSQTAVKTMYDIVSIKQALGRYDEATDYRQRALDLSLQLKDQSGAKISDAEIVKSQVELAVLLDLQQRYKQSEPIYRQALKWQVEHGTEEGALDIQENIALNYRMRGQLAEAAKEYRAVLDRRRKKNQSRKQVMQTVIRLCEALEAQNKHSEAANLREQVQTWSFGKGSRDAQSKRLSQAEGAAVVVT